MGACTSEEDEVIEQKTTIEEQNGCAELPPYVPVAKILVLGTSESGKSTLIRNIKSQFGDSLSKDDLSSFYDIIRLNLYTCLLALKFQPTKDDADKVLFSAHVKSLKDSEISLSPNSDLSPRYKVSQKTLDAFLAVHSPREISAAFQDMQFSSSFPDNGEYLLLSLERIVSPQYQPTLQDIMRARAKTCGLVETVLNLPNLQLKLIDVGGHRSQRSKWIHCFEGVDVLLFVVAASEYDLFLDEDENERRMTESLLIFYELCNSPWFNKTSFVLCFNKMDVLHDKIVRRRIDLSVQFPDFRSGLAYEESRARIQQEFLRMNLLRRDIRVFWTQATDADCIQKLFSSVHSLILDQRLRLAGLV